MEPQKTPELSYLSYLDEHTAAYVGSLSLDERGRHERRIDSLIGHDSNHRDEALVHQIYWSRVKNFADAPNRAFVPTIAARAVEDYRRALRKQHSA